MHLPKFKGRVQERDEQQLALLQPGKARGHRPTALCHRGGWAGTAPAGLPPPRGHAAPAEVPLPPTTRTRRTGGLWDKPRRSQGCLMVSISPRNDQRVQGWTPTAGIHQPLPSPSICSLPEPQGWP